MNVPALSEHTVRRDIEKGSVFTGPEIQVCMNFNPHHIVLMNELMVYRLRSSRQRLS